MKLKEIVEICYGKNQKLVEINNSEIPILGTGGVIGYASKPLYDKESVLIGRKGTIGMPFYINKPFWTIDTLFYTKINKEIVIPKYLYYLLCTIGLDKYSEGAAVPSLTTKTLYEIDLNIHPMIEQQHIVNTIGTIDDLIENKQKKVIQLEKISSLIYTKYIKEKESIISLGDVCEIKTGKLDANAAIINGAYPFFTCGKDTLKIDDFAFDDESIIISGNGEISVKYYKGKFNAYQRTYVLSPNKYFFLFLEECKSSVGELINNSQGSVIKFITKGMLEKISVPVNDNAKEIDNKLRNLYNQISLTKKEIEELTSIKKILLSKYF